MKFVSVASAICVALILCGCASGNHTARGRAAGGHAAGRHTARGNAAGGHATRRDHLADGEHHPGRPPRRIMRIFELNRISGEAYEHKDYPKALAAIQELVKLTPDEGGNWYNLGCLQCLMGHHDQALDSLEKAVKLGYAGIQHMERDTDLTALHDNGRFLAILHNRDQIQRSRAEKVLAALKARYGEGYTYEIDDAHRLIYVSSVEKRDFDEIRQRLCDYEAAERKTIFDHNVDEYIAVLIPKNYPHRPGQPGGFYSPAEKVLVVGSIGMVLNHEFTHAMHGADQEALDQVHPIWICEGMATTFEYSEVHNGRVVPLPNQRLNVLQMLIKANKIIPLANLVKLEPQVFQPHAMATYPEVRYLMLYLYDKGLMKKWYDTYVATYQKDKTGALALEQVLGKKLADVEKDWKAWVMKLAPPPLYVQANGAYLGVQVEPAMDGLLIRSTVPGAGADKAGLKAGDVILSLDGKRVVDPETLTELVTARKVGQVLPVEFRRGGNNRIAQVLLTAKPADIKPPTPTTKPATAPSTKP